MNSDMYKERIAALLKVIQATKIVKEDNIPCQIEEGLYLGSLGAANNRSALKSLNITHILTIAISLAPAHPNDFIYKIVEVPDREDITITQYFDECFAFIDEARARGGGVLVHCFAGRSRSVTVVVGYLMFKHGMSFTEALEYVKTKRPVASPNSGFMLQLQEYERSLQVNYFQLNQISTEILHAASRTGTVLEPEKCCSSL
ncbi:Dual specificity protein phosphatase 1 [Sesamum angolense]|uniref:Dual specificity protein phosphatase 1 n=1 Tax=Sesamum angolense TaxID=2727404 RepID=A0AAE2C1K9_9LAMI|nr:Dual specificity protein phosphatase 1 [Sesamum angolense]